MSNTKDALNIEADAFNKLSSVLIALISQIKTIQSERDQAKSELAELQKEKAENESLHKEDSDNATSISSTTENLNKLVDLANSALLPEVPATAPVETPVVVAPVVEPSAPVVVEATPAQEPAPAVEQAPVVESTPVAAAE